MYLCVASLTLQPRLPLLAISVPPHLLTAGARWSLLSWYFRGQNRRQSGKKAPTRFLGGSLSENRQSNLFAALTLSFQLRTRGLSKAAVSAGLSFQSHHELLTGTVAERDLLLLPTDAPASSSYKIDSTSRTSSTSRTLSAGLLKSSHTDLERSFSEFSPNMWCRKQGTDIPAIQSFQTLPSRPRSQLRAEYPKGLRRRKQVRVHGGYATQPLLPFDSCDCLQKRSSSPLRTRFGQRAIGQLRLLCDLRFLDSQTRRQLPNAAY
ncbi:hypothetical protein C8J57DRAFT_1474714 [Mycena rebaudengoi]|nr:hypothetical protein C8J57DRAFT_1474714 [Mycena rebaudengoi]